MNRHNRAEPGFGEEDWHAEEEARLCGERGWLLGKYDSGAVSAAVFAVLKQIEIDIAWLQHKE
jgi:hypothetical protein